VVAPTAEPAARAVAAALPAAAPASDEGAAAFEIGQTVLVRGIQAEAYRHLNRQLGTVTGEGEGEAAGRYQVQMQGSDGELDVLLAPEKLVLAPPRLPAALPAGWRFERESSSRPGEVVLSHRSVPPLEPSGH
jgi:hypothetical protein